MKGKKIWLLVVVIIGLCIGIICVFRNKEVKVVETEVKVTKEETLKGKLKMAVLADIHSDTVELERILEKVKNNQNQLVVVAGDLTIEGKYDELVKVKEELDDSGLNYLVVPGNHEYSRSNFEKVFGKNYQSFRGEGIKLILIDNGYWKGLGEEQKKWIENEVLECELMLCLAVMHKPLNNSFSSHVMGENNEVVTEEALWLKNLLVNFGVKRIEAGHLHYASSYELEGIRTDIVGAVSRERNNQSPRYTEIMINGDLIEREVIEGDIGN